MLFSEILYLYDQDQNGNAKAVGVCKVNMQGNRLTAQIDVKPLEPFDFQMERPYSIFQLGNKRFCTEKLELQNKKEIDTAEMAQSIIDTEKTETKNDTKVTDLFQLKVINSFWEQFRQNTFLLHGFYNYGHVWATKKVLGVPGNYYEREKQVAAMFGFDEFALVKDMYEDSQETSEPSDGDYGYYIRRITESK